MLIIFLFVFLALNPWMIYSCGFLFRLIFRVNSDELVLMKFAPVAELVDAADSKSVVRKNVGVRVSLGAPWFQSFLQEA